MMRRLVALGLLALAVVSGCTMADPESKGWTKLHDGFYRYDDTNGVSCYYHNTAGDVECVVVR